MRLRPDHPYVLLCLCSLFWAGNWIVGRGLRADLPPVALSFWRWVVAFACVLPFAWPHLRRQWPLVRRHARTLTLFGALGTAGYNALVYVGLQYTTATNGVLLNSFVPIVILALSAAVLGRRLPARQWAGAGLSLAGVLTIVARGNPDTLLAFRFNVGDVWILASVLGWAIYTMALVKRPAELHPLVFLASISATGLMTLAPFYAAELAAGRHITATFDSVLGVVYTGVFPAFLGYIFWNRAVSEVGGAVAGLFMHLMPVFGIVLSAIFLGEYPEAYHGLGIVLIFGGIGLSTLAAARAAQA